MSHDSVRMGEGKAVLAEGTACTQPEAPSQQGAGLAGPCVSDMRSARGAGSPQGGEPFSGRR